MNTIRSLFFLVAVSVLVGVVLPAEAAVTCPSTGVWSVVGGVCVPGDTGLSDSPISDILETIMYWLLGILGFIAIIAFVISGLQYLTAAGDEKQAETAKHNMQYSIIGIIVALSGLIVIYAISGALSGDSFF
ncbi:MAG: pilin [Candidatus Moraniibacteriota bacterium]